MNDGHRPLEVLEFFSGIGGMHYAFLYSNINVQTTPIDINESANIIYKHNFLDSKPLNINIELLTYNHEIFKTKVYDIWTLSPPCQPYTRQSIDAKDILDNRSNALSTVMSVLSKLSEDKLPSLIVIENVKNFEKSQSFELVKQTLALRNYDYRLFLITPLGLGFPNQRLRFYIIAIRKPKSFVKPLNLMDRNEIINTYQLLEIMLQDLKFKGDSDYDKMDVLVPKVDSFLDEDDSTFDIPSKLMDKKAFKCVDIVNSKLSFSIYQTDILNTSSNTILKIDHLQQREFKPYTLCFTRSYGRFLNGTGSLKFKTNNCTLSIKNTAPPIIGSNHNSKEPRDLEVNEKLKNSQVTQVDQIYLFQPYSEDTVNSLDNQKLTHNAKDVSHKYTVDISSTISSINKLPHNSHNLHVKSDLIFKDENISHYNSNKLLTLDYIEINNSEIKFQSFESSIDTSNQLSVSDQFNEMDKYRNNLRFFSPIEISRLMGFKGKYNNENNHLKGNSLWNLNHKQHTCYPKLNTNFCEAEDPEKEHHQQFVNQSNLKEQCLCFKYPFTFPSHVKKEMQWRLIGNSLNPQVVTCLLLVCGIDKLAKRESALC